MSEKIETEGKTREGRFHPKLTPGERKFIEKEAKRHNVTPNQMLEAMILTFFKEVDQKIYEKAKKTAAPEALELLQKVEEAKQLKDIAETKEIIKRSIKSFEDGEWWTETEYHFFVYAKGDKVTIPKAIMGALKIEDEQLLSFRIRTA